MFSGWTTKVQVTPLQSRPELFIHLLVYFLSNLWGHNILSPPLPLGGSTKKKNIFTDIF